MPLAARPRSTGAQVASEQQPELQDPSPGRLVRNIEAAFCQEFLDVAVAEREAQIEPDGGADDVRRVSYSPILGQIPGSFKLLRGIADRI